MINSVQYERSNSSEQLQINVLHESGGGSSYGDAEAQMEMMNETSSPVNKTSEGGTGVENVLCTHDGVLIKKASAEYIADLKTSGSLSLIECGTNKRLYIEWKPNENILIADDSQDQEDWALVDTISKRNRTESECKIFNVKPMESSTGSPKTSVIRTSLDDLLSIEVKQRRQTIKFNRKSDSSLFMEFFFQHGNADLFLSSLKNLHVIELATTGYEGEEYVIFPTETQKLKKTFAELDIGEIKSSSVSKEGWLPHRVVGLLASIPDYMANKNPPKYRPGSLDTKEGQKSPTPSDNYQIVGVTDSTNTSNTDSREGSLEKSPDIDCSELENVKEINEEKIKSTLPDRRPILRGFGLTESEWLQFQTPEGRITDPSRVLELVFKGGMDNKLRPDVWKYLLNYYKWDETEMECKTRRQQKTKEYYVMKAQWLSMTKEQEANFSGYRERKCQIEKDVKRTDRSLDYFAGDDNPNLYVLQGILMTYVMYNFDLGYVQGMSDLLAPILAIMANEVDAFWCFVGFMEMIFANFDIDQAGMKNQFKQLRTLLQFANPRLFKYMLSNDSDNMYFCFRWLLVWYKREFSNEDILKLWECLWTKLPCPNYHLIISLAILDQETDTIIKNQYEFNEILKHVNELSGNIDLKHTLEIAEAIYYQLKDSTNLPNSIRLIIGEPLQENEGVSEGDSESPEQFEDDFDEYIKELTPEEKKRNQEWLEEACERSMFLQYM